MSSPIALPTAPLLASAAAAVASPVVTILDGAAQALATLSEATQISGTVTASDTPGEITLLTALGTIALKTPLPLPAGTQLVLQAIADRPGAATVVAINDSPTAPRATPPAPAAIAPPPSAPPPAVLALGTTVTATMVGDNEVPLPDNRPAPASPAAATAAPSATAEADGPVPANPTASGRAAAPLPQAPPTATGSLARLAALVAPTARTMPELRTGQAAAVAAGAATPSARPVAAVQAESVRLAAPGSNVAIRILAVQPTATPGSPATPVLSGIVRPSPPSLPGMLVETPAGLLRLYPDTDPATGQRAAPVLPGTPVALRLLAGSPPAALLSLVTEGALPASIAEPAETTRKPAETATDEAAGAPAAPADGAEPPPAHLALRVLLNAPGPTTPSPQMPGSTTAVSTTPSPTPPELTTPGQRQAAETAAAPPLMVGTVITANAGATSAATLIATPLGTLSVNEPLPLPPGTLLLLAAQPDDASVPDSPAGTPSSRFDKGWSALGATLTTLGHAAPELAAHLRADLSTQSGERLAASLIVLVAALRNNAPRLWPGDAIERALSTAGHDDIKLKLGEEFAEISRLADNPATNPWQVFLLPLIDGPTIRPVRLYLKRRGERGRRSSEDDSARFVLEFELTRLGLLQLDGFVRPQRFDLVLRSHAALALPLRSEVERIFHERVDAAGIAGTIDFATAVRFDVAPLDKLRVKVGLAV
jgi:hypothetical protein